MQGALQPLLLSDIMVSVKKLFECRILRVNVLVPYISERKLQVALIVDKKGNLVFSQESGPLGHKNPAPTVFIAHNQSRSINVSLKVELDIL